MKKIFYHTGSLLISIPVLVIGLILVLVDTKWTFISLLCLFSATYLSGTWRALEIDKSNGRIRRIKGFLWMEFGDWEAIERYDSVYIGPERHNADSSRLNPVNYKHTTFNVYLVDKLGMRHTIEKPGTLDEAIKHGRSYSRYAGLKFDMWKWPGKIRNLNK